MGLMGGKIGGQGGYGSGFGGSGRSHQQLPPGGGQGGRQQQQQRPHLLRHPQQQPFLKGKLLPGYPLGVGMEQDPFV